MESNINKEIIHNKTAPQKSMSGISVPEILIVLVIMGVLTAISLPYIVNFKKLYKPEDQALKIMDLMREANQMALTRRRTMRLEIDLTDNKILIIDEDTTVTPAVHREIKAIPLEAVRDVQMEGTPTDISIPAPPSYAAAGYVTDAVGHKRGSTTVTGHKVWAIRFRRDGSVVNASNTLASATLFLWTPISPTNLTTPRKKEEVRAITIFGGSGAIRYWKHNGTTFVPYN